MTKLDHSRDRLELAIQANWSVLRLAKLCGVSVRKLERDFHKMMEQSTKTWLLEQRQRLAMELLQNGWLVKEVAIELGYKHPHHFSRDFKKYWGICPTEFNPNAPERKKCRVLV